MSAPGKAGTGQGSSGRLNITQSNYHWYVLATVFIGTFMAPLDSSIVNIALPTLSKHFNVGITTIEWVVMSYLLTASALLLSAGRLGDIKGHKLVYITGFVTFTAASALCGFAQSIEQLIAFRVLQALGATGMLANGPAILTHAFPPKERGKALGMIGISVSIGLTVGPFLGGILISTLGWRWIFFVNIPIGIVASAVAFIVLRESKVEEKKRFDVPGAATAFVALFSVLLALSLGNTWGWTSAQTIVLFALAAVFFAAFLVVEKSAKEPMLNLSLFKIRLFSAANVSALLNFVALFVVLFLVPFYLLEVYNQSPRTAGIILTAVPLVTAVVAPVAGTLSDKIGSRLLSSLGLAITVAAMFGLSRTTVASGLMPIGLLLGVVGLGSGMFQSPNASAALGSVPKSSLGIASAMQATVRNVGMVLGIALAGAIISTYAPKGAADPNLSAAIHTAFIAGAIASALGVVTSLVRGPGAQTAPEPLKEPATSPQRP